MSTAVHTDRFGKTWAIERTDRRAQYGATVYPQWRARRDEGGREIVISGPEFTTRKHLVAYLDGRV